MDLVREIVYKRRIRINQYFGDFDYLKSGFVTRDQFHRCLSSLHINLPPEKLKLIQNTYYNEEKKKINYVQFSKDVNIVFVTHDLEKNPLEKELDPSQFLKRKPHLDNVEDEKLEDILSKIRFQCYKRGFRIRHCFLDFDVHNVGIVTYSQFIRGMPFVDLKISDYEILARRYATDESLLYVNYKIFNEEVTKGVQRGGTENIQEEKEEKFVIEDIEKSQNKRIPVSLKGVEAKLERLVFQNRIRIDEPFRDFDPLRKGYVTPNQFQSVFGMIKFPKEQFCKEEIELLTKKYQIDELRLDYNTFLKEINGLFFTEGMEKQPLSDYSSPSIPVTEKHLYEESMKKFSLTEEEKKELEDVEDEIKARVKSERIMLKQMFLDFDKASKGTRSYYISYARFCRVLASLGFKLPQNQFSLLCKAYDDIHSGNMVNYVNFLKRVNFEVSNELIQ